MSKFKVGDRVRCVDVGTTWEIFYGLIYNVKEINPEFKALKVYGSEYWYDFCSFELVGEETEMKEFDFKTGMRVVHRNGDVGIVLKDIGVIAYIDGFNVLSSFNSMLCEDREEWDIVEVYEGYTKNRRLVDFSQKGKLIWKESTETQAQKELRTLQEQISKLQEQANKIQKAMEEEK